MRSFVIGKQMVTEINLDEQIIATWCMQFTMLRFGLIDSLSIVGENPETRITVAVHPFLVEEDVEVRPRHVDWTKDSIKLYLHVYSFGNLLIWPLKYYRDGRGDGDHIDEEFYPRDTAPYEKFTLSLTVPKAVSQSRIGKR
jgi:hypothetical protein